MFKKISTCLILAIFLPLRSYAIYHYSYNLNAYKLKRDNLPISYTFNRNNSEGYTNQDVDIVLEFNKKIEGLSGYEVLEDGRKFKKTLKENEEASFVASDIYGNKCEVSYNVNNVDKEPPDIINIENGLTYSAPIIPAYYDNIGISQIDVKKYNNIKLAFFPDYYDSSDYKGIGVLNNSIHIGVKDSPRGTASYKYYLNNELKANTIEKEYTFTNLNSFTNYNIRVDAVNENGTTIQTATRDTRTKLISNITDEKNADSINVKLYGIDRRVARINSVKFNREHPNNKIYTNLNIKSDRTIEESMSAYELEPTLIDTYYFLHFQMWDSNNQLLEAICVNVEFGKDYNPVNNQIDIYNLTQSGEYDITLVDVAGNVTKKSFIINV